MLILRQRCICIVLYSIVYHRRTFGDPTVKMHNDMANIQMHLK